METFWGADLEPWLGDSPSLREFGRGYDPEQDPGYEELLSKALAPAPAVPAR